MEHNLKGKVALVTGAANGVGAHIVRMLLDEGVKHVAILDVDEAAGIAYQKELTAKYGAGKALFHRVDVTNATAGSQDGLDLVINNAGVMNDAPHIYKKEIAINVTALITSTLKALELMRKDDDGRGGTVINIASIAGLCQLSVMPIYWATKAAVIQFSNCIGKEDYYEKTGVRVVTVCYGATATALIATENLGSLDTNLDGTNVSSALKDRDPIQRVESAAQGVIEAYKKGASGSTWVATRDLPAVDITDNVNRAYDILGEHN